jgi:outer membrane protein assembly factor BamD (BamD/ComL family)
MNMLSSANAVIASAALGAMIGCAGVWPEKSEQQQVQLQQQASQAVQNKLLAAQKLAQGAKFTDALSAYRLILQEHPGTEWAPDAKYGIALVYASADNPQRDYAAAAAEFDQFLSLYPSDKRAAEAKSWRQALKALVDTKKDNDRLNKNIEKLKQLDVRQEEKRLGR